MPVHSYSNIGANCNDDSSKQNKGTIKRTCRGFIYGVQLHQAGITFMQNLTESNRSTLQLAYNQSRVLS